MDYDPFINGQDFSASTIKKSLLIDSIDTNTFEVRLKYFDTDSLSRIVLELEHGSNNEMNISMIKNNPIIN